jgi:hypothetical protein
MSEARLLTRLLAARRLLATANPALLAWASEQWEAWLLSQRSDPPNPSKPRLFAVATLSCLEDLSLHVGLMQLLAEPSFRCTVLLSVPTQEVARIIGAQARRGGWQHLVHIAVESECLRLLDRLPANSALAVFRLPCAITRDDLDHFTGNGSTHAALDVGQTHRRHVFVGRAADFAEWNSMRQEADEDSWLEAIDRLRAESPELLADEWTFAPSAKRWWPRALTWNGAVQLHQAGVDVPGVDDNDDLIIRTSREPRDPVVIARRYSRLCEADAPLKIRTPGALLTTAPQVLRVEAHKPDGSIRGTDLLVRVPPSRIEPWMVSAFLNRGGGGNPMIRAFAAGIGCRIAYAEDEPELLSDIPVVWGVLRDSDRILAQAKAQSLYFFYIDHAYFDRGHGKSYRITRNRYEAGPVRDWPSDRFAEFAVDVRPWRKSGHEIIVCPPTDYFMRAHDCLDWLETTLDALRSYTDRPIIIREKPQPGETAVPLETALKPAHALVTHSSNVAIEAACLGTPVFVDPASAAAPIGQTDLAMIETPTYPEREAWLAHLAYSQFSFDEIRNGTAWRLLLETEERDVV